MASSAASAAGGGSAGGKAKKTQLLLSLKNDVKTLQSSLASEVEVRRGRMNAGWVAGWLGGSKPT